MRVDKLDQAYRNVEDDERAQKQATSSKIKIPSIDVSKEAYKSAQDVAKVVGTDKIFKATVDWSITYNWSDGTETESGAFQVFLFSQDAEDAKSRLKLFFPSYSYSIRDISEISKEQAEAQIQKNFEDKYYPGNGATKDACDHILTLPTKKMYDEMKTSIDWAINLLKKMKDQDEADRRARWLQTNEGKAWLAKYEADKKILEQLKAKRELAIQKREAKQKQQEENEDDIIDILRKQSKKYPQYKDGIAPVIVEGGRKFKGKGFAISWEDCSGNDNWVPCILPSGRIAHDYDYYHRNDEWTNAIIYDPASKKIQKANIKFCRVDTSVSNDQCVEVFKQYCEDKVESTIAWCRSKDPKKSDFEIKNWAKNIIKKYHPWIEIDKYITFDQKDIDNATSNKVASTVDWAISLGKGQAETERIIMRALSKKGIDYKNFQEVISMKLQLKFGRDPKVLTFRE